MAIPGWIETNIWIDESLSLRLCLTLLHSLWLGTLAGLFVFLVTRCLKSITSSARYWFNVVVLFGLTGLLIFVFVSIKVTSKSPRAVVADSEATVGASEFNVQPSIAVEPNDAQLDGKCEPETARLANHLVDSENSKVCETVPNEHAATSSPRSWEFRSLAPLLSLAYLIGATTMFCRLAIATFGAHRLRRASHPIVDKPILLMAKEQAKRIGLKFMPAVAFCEQISIPIVVGVVKPMILLPLSIQTGMSPEQIRALLTHELAHIRRFDTLINLVQRMAESLLFFHPAIWYISRRISVERENATDDAVVRTGWQPTNYADALLRMAEICLAARKRPSSSIATIGASGESASDLKRRVLRLLDQPEPPKFRFTRTGVMATLFVLAVILFTPAVVQSWSDPIEPKVTTDENQPEVEIPKLQIVQPEKPAPSQKADDPFANEGPKKKPTVVKDGATIILTVLDQYGQPIERSSVTTFRALAADEKSHASDWQDPVTQKTWRVLNDKHVFIRPDRTNIGVRQSTATIAGLHPGTYRLVAATNSRTATPIAIGDPIELAKKQSRQLTLRMLAGTRVRFHVADVDGGPLDHSSVWMAKTPKTIPPHMIGLPVRDGATTTFENLRPGKYEFTVEQEAFRPTQLEFEKTTHVVEVGENGTQVVRVRLKGHKLDGEEISKRWPYVVEGIVTNADGDPMPGVRICACDETEHEYPWTPSKLFYCGETLTDHNGRYQLRFRGIYPTTGKIVSFSPEEILIAASKEGFVEQNANRHERLTCALRMPTKVERPKGFDAKKLLLPNKPRTRNFVMVSQVDLRVRLTDIAGRPVQKTTFMIHGSASPELGSPRMTQTNSSGECTMSHLAPNREFWFSLHQGSGNERTPKLKFPKPGKYLVQLATKVDQATGLDRFQVVSINSSDTVQWKDRVIVANQRQLNATEKATHERGMEILKNLRQVNRNWLGVPPEEIKNYTYLFRTTGAGHRFGRVLDPSQSALINRRGIRYISTIDKVVRNLDNVTIRAITTKGDLTTIEFDVHVPFQVEIGMGSGGSSAQMAVERGTFVIDRRTHTLVESRTKHITEKYSNYIPIREGFFVPRRVWVSFQETELHFRVHHPGLWLFDRAFQKGDKSKAAAYIDHLDINNRLLGKESE